MDWICWGMPFFNFLGLLLAIYKKKEAFAVFMIPNIYWIVYTISHKTYPMTIVQIIYIAFSIWGYFKWRKEVRKEAEKVEIIPFRLIE